MTAASVHFPKSPIVFACVVCVIFGGMAGGLAGAWTASVRVSRLPQISSGSVVTSTRPTTEAVLPLERRSAATYYPSFATRRLSPSLALVRRVGVADRSADVRFIPADRTVGQAVSVTADGWLVTSYSALPGGRVNDVEAIWAGRSYPILRAIRDTATDLVYLKIDVSGLPAVAYLASADVVVGSPSWIETTFERFVPDVILDTRADASTVPVSSERASRRFLIGSTGSFVAGSGVWDEQGRLLGLLDQKMSDGWRVLPVGTVPSSAASLAERGSIERAILGVRSVTLASSRFEGSRGTLPQQGAWIIADRQRGLSAVSARTPAAGLVREGDVIERVERDILDGHADLGERLLDYRPGTKITLYGVRDRTPFQVTVLLGKAVTSENLK